MMIQCSECEFFKRGENGEVGFGCDPFSNVKEPECLVKWQLIKINQMVAGYQATMKYNEKMAPLQEKVFNMMEREIDAIDETEKWKSDDDDDEFDILEDSGGDDDDGDGDGEYEDWRTSL
ncbi:MAG: hypothetical protein KAR11_00225 [Phycisphaerae bacterium]|nr:hypothetical protein [Phycisphaerae bacterium]